MIDDVYKEFFTDYQTQRVMNSSEVWKKYSSAELARDQIREKRAAEAALDRENEILESIEDFRNKVASNPELKAHLKKAAEYLEQHPELKEKTDPGFLMGLSLLDLED